MHFHHSFLYYVALPVPLLVYHYSLTSRTQAPRERRLAWLVLPAFAPAAPSALLDPLLLRIQASVPTAPLRSRL